MTDIVKYHVGTTIDILGLNEDDYVDERIGIIKEYSLGHFTIDDLDHLYPFIAVEIRRTDFDNTLKPMMRAFFQGHKP